MHVWFGTRTQGEKLGRDGVALHVCAAEASTPGRKEPAPAAGAPRAGRRSPALAARNYQRYQEFVAKIPEGLLNKVISDG